MESQESNYIVYKHTSPSNKVYIGITRQNVTNRWSNGFGYQTQQYFFRAIVKYGWINFKHEILFDGLTKEEALSKEKELIAQYHSSNIHYGYNIDDGTCSFLQHKKVIDKRKLALKGRPWTLSQRENISRALDTKVGRVVLKYSGNELIQRFDNVRVAAKDAGYSTEGLRSKLNRKNPTIINGYLYCYEVPNEFKTTPLDDRNYVTRPVLVYDLSHNLIGEYKSIAQAARALNIKKPGHVQDVCKGKRSQSHGYIWRYKYEN